MLIQPVVLSGGSGTRLWPLSREKYPKQLLPLIGEDSLLQATVRRVEGIAGVQLAPPMIVCNEEYRFVIAEQMRLMGKKGDIVLEPIGRNTAPALTLAALAAMRDGGDPILLGMPAEPVIRDTPAFLPGGRAFPWPGAGEEGTLADWIELRAGNVAGELAGTRTATTPRMGRGPGGPGGPRRPGGPQLGGPGGLVPPPGR